MLRDGWHYFNRRWRKQDIRIQRSAETKSAKEFRYRDGLLTKLAKGGHWDTLKMLQTGALAIGDLIVADKSGRLETVGRDLVMYQRLAEQVAAWLPHSAPAKQSRRRYATSWRRFWTFTGFDESEYRVAQLADVKWKQMYTRWDTSAADWNRMRAAISTFLSDHLGNKYHPFRLDVMGRFPMLDEGDGRIPDLSVPQFWSIIDAADVRCQPAYVAMAVLGVGPAEYLSIKAEDLNPETLMVHIRGTKNRRRDDWVAVDERMWEWIEYAVPAPLQYRWLNNYWHRACQAAGVSGVIMYDLRHLSGQIAGDQGVTDRDLQTHLRHKSARTTHRYTRRRTAKNAARAIADGLAREA